MKFKTGMFKGLILIKGYTLNHVAKWLDINMSTLYRKMARNGDFSRKEIEILIDELELTTEEMNKIFFENQLA